VAGLRASARAADGRAPATPLTKSLLTACGLTRPDELVGVVYCGGDRATLAALAPTVLEAAESGDPTANEIIDTGASELASAAAAAARSLGLPAAFPVALAGGLLTACPAYRRRFLTALAARGLTADPVTVVAEPAQGAVRLALAMIGVDAPAPSA
jgi:N-acetylglucosamine kinase-like BadF-type ATPase